MHNMMVSQTKKRIPEHWGHGSIRNGWQQRLAAVGIVAVGCLTVGDGQSMAADLRPGVQPGEIVVMREVEPAYAGWVDRDNGPIRARADLMSGSRMANAATHRVHGQMQGVTAIMLSDSEAASISSGIGGATQRLHQALGTNPSASHRGSTGGLSGSISSGLGGHAGGAGGGIGGVRGVTSGIAGSVTGALAPLTAGRP
ncbi:hypothetical protein [Halomonas binhaiensis]|uniref:Uncharacterized protein n=1 Tax=Halomonas binhaiensis TaxID=2562282 RepID=A0A5C1NCY2_9GAMM|nr:hypothetical protein [Halomonas binhaiensis]QEM80820.1 hypothetical protein E4T21_04075 [Halomonas binhaiensis]